MSNPIYITSTCVISGNALFKNGQLLFEDRSVPATGFLMSAYRHFNLQYPKFYKMDALCRSGWLASEMLLSGAALNTRYQPAEIGLLLTNSSSSLDTDLRYFETTKDIASPALFVYTLPNIVIGEICIRHHIKGENVFFITPNFDAGFISQYVAGLFQNDLVKACVCGWVEIMDGEHKTVLILTENRPGEVNLPFTEENLNKTYQLEHG